MGGSTSRVDLGSVQERAKVCAGALSTTGRFHRLPRRLQDDYVLEQKVLGTGYNGTVHLATSRLNGQHFAVKSIKLAGVSSAKRKELESECEIFLCMDHPHVACLVDVYESETQLDLVMECLNGGELLKRLTQKQKLAENDARDASWQMLLAISYLHSHTVVHRDIKLENWMYEENSSDHLKLIDFGFSQRCTPGTTMTEACGTMEYAAPELLKQSYTLQCDMWSFGVTVFALLFGYLPFHGQKHQIRKCILSGKYVVKNKCWSKVSHEAQDFVKQLLVLDPNQRLTAKQALEHSWIKSRDEIERAYNFANEAIADALISFARASQFRRVAMHMMALSLSNNEQAQVRKAFIGMDVNRSGAITTSEFKQVFKENFQIGGEQVTEAFRALDANNQDEIRYTEFLAAMVSSQIQIHEELLQAAFNRFDTDSTGYITDDNLQRVLGDSCSPDLISAMIWDADLSKDNQISYQEFTSYLLDINASTHEAVAFMVDEDTKPRFQTLEEGYAITEHQDAVAFMGDNDTKPGFQTLEEGYAITEHQEVVAIMVDKDTKPRFQTFEEGYAITEHQDAVAFMVDNDTKPGFQTLEEGYAITEHQEVVAFMVDKDTKPGFPTLKEGYEITDHQEAVAFMVDKDTKPAFQILKEGPASMNSPQCCCCMQ